jgi:hypothetical protein
VYFKIGLVVQTFWTFCNVQLMVEVLTFSDKSEAQYVGLREEKAGAI